MDLQGRGADRRSHRPDRILDASGEPVAVWNVIDIWPTRWTGPNMDVNGKDTAFETLELAHNGFSVA